jgi:hypothetical protein
MTTEVSVLCLDLIKSEPFNMDVTLPRTYKDEKTMMKKVSALIDNDERKAVHIVHSQVVETLYGMPEEEFIIAAEVLPPRKDYTKSNDEE